MTLRMSFADRARLQQEASALGTSVQVMLERRLLNKEDAAERRPGPSVRDPELDLGITVDQASRRPQEVLPLTG